MIHDEICTYEVAKLAREKGFPQDVFGTCEMKSACYLDDGRFYKDGCICPIEKAYTAPTQNLLQRWLREEKKIYIAISVDIDHDLHRVCFEYGVCYDFDGRTMEYHNSYDSFGQYEDALEDALKWTLENLV